MVARAIVLWDVVPFLFILFNIASFAFPGIYNVVELGAKADGKTDSSKTFLTA